MIGVRVKRRGLGIMLTLVKLKEEHQGYRALVHCQTFPKVSAPSLLSMQVRCRVAF